MSLFAGSPDQPAATDAFGYEVFRCTAALLFLLEGMEAVRAFRPCPSASEPERVYPMLSEIALALVLETPGYGSARLFESGAEVEQLAYRGWIERLAALAEPQRARSRQVWSDLRAIREDLVGNQGLASETGSGACSTLVWFRAGEPIRFAIRHVLDLFNQFALLGPGIAATGSGLAARWTLLARFEQSPAADRIPELVSLRPAIAACEAHGGADSSHDSTGCVVFADGIFAELRAPEAHEMWIDEQGDLRLADGSVLSRVCLYRNAVATLSGEPAAIRPGVGPQQPTHQRGADRA